MNEERQENRTDGQMIEMKPWNAVIESLDSEFVARWRGIPSATATIRFLVEASGGMCNQRQVMYALRPLLAARNAQPKAQALLLQFPIRRGRRK
jgi:hypothetical protein